MAARMTVGEYIRSTWGAAWEWGVVDCTMWPADWCLLSWGCDPAEAFRGAYSDAAGARKIIGDGMLVPTIDSVIEHLRREVPREGDVGVIHIAGLQVGAIRISDKWAFRKPSGVGIVRADAVAVWGV